EPRSIKKSFIRILSSALLLCYFVSFFNKYIHIMKLIAVSSIALVFLSQVLAKPALGCLQTHIVASNESCVSVAALFNLLEADFYTMNPGLHHSAEHNCDNLDTGKPYCVCMEEPCTPEPASSPSANTTSSNATNIVLSASNVVKPSSAMVSASSVAAPSQAASNVSTASSRPAASSSPAASSLSVTPAGNSKSTNDTASQNTKPTSGAVSISATINGLTLGAIMAGASLLL
ncbi:hypothetical protein A0J61_03429, partial [Choanephora cucurbitarum]